MKTHNGVKLVSAMAGAVLAAWIAVPGVQAIPPEDELKLVCSPGLMGTATSLAEEYTREFPGSPVRVNPVQGTKLETLIGGGAIALVDKEGLAGLAKDPAFTMVVGREVIIPVVSVENPGVERMIQQGISPEQFGRILRTGASVTWGEIIGNSDKHPVRVLATANERTRSRLAEFTGMEPVDLRWEEVPDDATLAGCLLNDPYAIGFCSLSFLAGMEKEGTSPGLSFVPIDNNGNGRVDYFEDIYDNCSDLSHAIFIGKFPRTLYSRVYALASEMPAGQAKIAFLEWMVEGGQVTLASNGILGIGFSERASGLRQISGTPEVVDVPVNAPAARLPWILAGTLLILALSVWLLVRILGDRSRTVSLRKPVEQRAFSPGSVIFPGGYYFDRSHTWAYMEKEGNVRIGIDDFMQHVTGPLTRVMMKGEGEKVTKGEPFLTLVQQGKKLVIKSPVTGTIVATNPEVKTDASILNSDPYENGWICRVKPVSWFSEMKTFFMGEPYLDWIRTEFSRLKDFFASLSGFEGGKGALVVMQDGGEILDGALRDLGPEVWEEFQTSFLMRTR